MKEKYMYIYYQEYVDMTEELKVLRNLIIDIHSGKIENKEINNELINLNKEFEWWT